MWGGAVSALIQVFHRPLCRLSSLWQCATVLNSLHVKPVIMFIPAHTYAWIKSFPFIIFSLFFFFLGPLPSVSERGRCWWYSRGIALCVGQVLHQNIQTFILLIQKLLGPPTDKDKQKKSQRNWLQRKRNTYSLIHSVNRLCVFVQLHRGSARNTHVSEGQNNMACYILTKTLTQCDWCEGISLVLLGPEWRPGPASWTETGDETKG